MGGAANRKDPLFCPALLLVAPRAADDRIKTMPIERLLQRLGLHYRGMQHRTRRDRADPALKPFLIDMNDQLQPETRRCRVAKFDHLAELPGRVDMEQRHRKLRGIKRLARKVQEDARIL